eukprot:gene14336-biopygen1909
MALLTRALPLGVCELTAALVCATAIAADASAVQLGEFFAPIQLWCFNIVVLDMALVINARLGLSRGICAATILWQG